MDEVPLHPSKITVQFLENVSSMLPKDCFFWLSIQFQTANSAFFSGNSGNYFYYD